jgi:hypothetical protein
VDGKGPRAIASVGSKLVVANYFSYNVSIIDLSQREPEVVSIELAPPSVPSAARLGERRFNDAALCFQQWQSCASCHDVDGRMDALNWDLLNDGAGNPKNAKSLVWAHQTPPAMALGVRPNAEAAVSAEIIHLLFSEQPKEVTFAMNEFLKSLEPVPSPSLSDPTLADRIQRGRSLFNQPRIGCNDLSSPTPFHRSSDS